MPMIDGGALALPGLRVGVHTGDAARRQARIKLGLLIAVTLVAAAAFLFVGVNFASPKLSAYAMKTRIPKNPQRVAILDLASLDIIDSLGEGDSVVASASTDLDYLQKCVDNPDVASIGTIKEPDMEAVAAAEPDIIFIGGRLSSCYDQLSEIAPVVYLADDSGDDGVYAGTKRDAEQIAKIFGDEDKVASLFTDFDARIAKLQEAAYGQTAVIGMATAGSFNVIGNDGRLSLIVNEIGFNNIGASVASTNTHGGGGGQGGQGGGQGASATGGESNPHGTEFSFETVVSLDPD